MQKAIKYLEKYLKIAIGVGDLAGQGEVYGNFGDAHQSLGHYRRAFEFLEKQLKISVEIGDRDGEGRAYGNLGIA